jgi:uncharacterized protein YecE (DUF72 family)
MTELRIGTSAFTAAGWELAFYPAGMKAADCLTYYGTKFNPVEVDSALYRTSSPHRLERHRDYRGSLTFQTYR